MDIKVLYDNLCSKTLTKDDVNYINKLKSDLLSTNFEEYYLLFDLLVIDYYINNEDYTKALEVAILDYNIISLRKYKSTFILLLNQIIYLYFLNKKYKDAFFFANNKKEYLDENDSSSVNRWYLEMAYIYVETMQKEKAVVSFKAILNNMPDDDILSITLSNLTKLYIDQKMIKEAKESLNECLKIALKIDDKEGLEYCDYLNAKLLILEGDVLLAKKAFSLVFENKTSFKETDIEFGNEYVSFLIDNNYYKEAYSYYDKYSLFYKDIKDPFILKHYKQNLLKLNMQNDETNLKLINDIISLENIITNKKEELLLNDTNINNDDESDVKKTNFDEIIINANESLKNTTLRNFLLDISKVIETIVSFEDITYVIYDINEFEYIPAYLKNNNFATYTYKKNRLYERFFQMDDLKNTLFEKLLSGSDFFISNNDNNSFIDLVKRKEYSSLEINNLFGASFVYNNETFASFVISSKNKSFNNKDVIILKFIIKLIENKLISLSLIKNYMIAREIEEINNNDYLSYYNFKNDKMVISNKLKEILSISSRFLLRSNYEKFVANEDLEKYKLSFNDIEKKKEYNIYYHLHIDNKYIYINEKMSPLFDENGEVIFYFGNTKVIENDKNAIKEKAEYENKLIEMIDSNNKFSIVRLYLKGLNKLNYLDNKKTLEEACKIINTNLSTNSYLMPNNDIYVLTEYIELQSLQRIVRRTINLIKKSKSFDNLLIKALIVRYKIDVKTLNDLNATLNLDLNYCDDITIMNNEIYKSYLKNKEISRQIELSLNNNDYELLFVNIKDNCYFLRYNIKGLNFKDDYFVNLPLNQKTRFEENAFYKLLSLLNNTANNCYMEISIFTLTKLVNNGYFDSNNEAYKNISFIITDYCIDFADIIFCLKEKFANIFIVNKVFEALSLKDIMNIKFDGVIFYNENDMINIINVAKFILIDKNNIYSNNICKEI